MNKTIGIIAGIVVAIGMIVGISWKLNDYKEQIEITEQNLIAARGEVEELKYANDEIAYIRDSYIMKAKGLEEMFGMKEREIKELKKKLGDSFAHISKLEQQVRYDTIEIIRDSVIYLPASTDIRFRYSNQWLSLDGNTILKDSLANTTITNLTMNVPLTIGLTDNYKIFAKSDNPYVSFTSIEGASLEGSKMVPKKDYFSWGIQVGLGGVYDMIDRNISVGPYLGVGVQINL